MLSVWMNMLHLLSVIQTGFALPVVSKPLVTEHLSMLSNQQSDFRSANDLQYLPGRQLITPVGNEKASRLGQSMSDRVNKLLKLSDVTRESPANKSLSSPLLSNFNGAERDLDERYKTQEEWETRNVNEIFERITASREQLASERAEARKLREKNRRDAVDLEIMKSKEQKEKAGWIQMLRTLNVSESQFNSSVLSKQELPFNVEQ